LQRDVGCVRGFVYANNADRPLAMVDHPGLKRGEGVDLSSKAVADRIHESRSISA
jgi:hypothetical protein